MVEPDQNKAMHLQIATEVSIGSSASLLNINTTLRNLKRAPFLHKTEEQLDDD